MKSRSGKSLIELMVVIALASVVLGLTGILFERLFQADRMATRNSLRELTTSRLADQFRRDVHASQTTRRTVTPEDSLPRLELGNGPGESRIVYRAGQNNVQREVIGLEGRTATESYRLPDSRVTFPGTEQKGKEEHHESVEQKSGIVTLSIERTPITLTASPHTSSLRRPITIEAELGRDLKWTRAEVLPVVTKSGEGLP